MKTTSDQWWANECSEPFSFLVRDFGFAGPTETRGGNELTAHYRRGNRSVNVVHVPGSFPFVELYTSSESIHHRSFVRGASKLGEDLSDSGEGLKSALRIRAEELLNNERKFLAEYDDA
jgi:hypothetical protein